MRSGGTWQSAAGTPSGAARRPPALTRTRQTVHAAVERRWPTIRLLAAPVLAAPDEASNRRIRRMRGREAASRRTDCAAPCARQLTRHRCAHRCGRRDRGVGGAAAAHRGPNHCALAIGSREATSGPRRRKPARRPVAPARHQRPDARRPAAMAVSRRFVGRPRSGTLPPAAIRQPPCQRCRVVSIVPKGATSRGAAGVTQRALVGTGRRPLRSGAPFLRVVAPFRNPGTRPPRP